ncbi:MAG: hypothetical protein E6K18_08140 [Methanobacteriota archaeon]|nr:MAG: hypothetical protein E6K18_08140 [Euryarchaeota archaeon]
MADKVFWREVRDGIRLVWRSKFGKSNMETALGQVENRFSWRNEKNTFRVGGNLESLNWGWKDIGEAKTLEEGKRMLVEAVRGGRLVRDIAGLKEAEWDLEKVVSLPGKKKAQ